MMAYRGWENVRTRLSASLVLAVSLLVFVGELSAQQTEEDRDLREIRQYRLTMDKLNRYLTAGKNMAKLAAADPTLCAATERRSIDERKSLSEEARRMEAAHPQVGPILKAAGLSAREYLLISLAWMSGGMAVAFKKQGLLKELPPEVSAENVAFLEKNEKELDAWQAEWAKIQDPCERQRKRAEEESSEEPPPQEESSEE